MRSIPDHPLRNEDSISRPYAYVLSIIAPASVEFLVEPQNQVVNAPQVFVGGEREVLRLRFRNVCPR